MKRTILIFGGIAGAFILLVRLSRYSLHSQSINSDTFIGIAALLLVGIGVLISYLFKPKTIESNKQSTIDQRQIEKIGLSNREYEILSLMAKGLSNAEIGNQLFISLSTVKSHVSNILMKLDAKRRTQAVEKARQLQLLP